METVEATIAAALRGDASDVTVGDMIEAIGRRGQAALVMVPALAVATPLSGIPGMATVAGALIALCAGQMALGATRIWLPSRLRRVTLPRERLDRAAPLLGRLARLIDRTARPRWQLLVAAPAQRAGAALAALLGLAMPVLEFIPFSSSIVGTFIAIMMAGFLTRDGLIVACALLPVALIGGAGAAAAELFGGLTPGG